MKLAVPKAPDPSELRVALVPEVIPKLAKAGLEVLVEAGAGSSAGFTDEAYTAAGARIVPDPAGLYGEADVILLLHPPSPEELGRLRGGIILISLLNALVRHDVVRQLAERGVSALALELMPRITRAQSMDILSSMSNIAGYKAVLIAASHLPRMFPMMMTAAGTITPARVLVLGAGVAGLQAIATAKRLGAVVEAYDVRAVVKEQVESLGARFVQVEAPPEDAQDKGGYAKEVSEAYKAKQREAIHKHVKENDVVISTALIPGKPAPRLIDAAMVRDMKPGSVIVDLAGEAGGNCELSRPGQTVVEHGVTILAPLNLPSTVAFHASQLFARNVAAFLLHLTKNGVVQLDPADEITRETLVTHEGRIVHERIRRLAGLPEDAAQPQAAVAGAA